jgi:hypothetical protein
MPYLYPIKDNKGQIVIKHLTNFDWMSQKTSVVHKMENFSNCYLKRSLQDTTNDIDVQITGLYFYPGKDRSTSYQDHYVIDESIDFVNTNYHDMFNRSGGSNTKIKGKKASRNEKSISLKDIIEDPHYITLKKREIDVQIKYYSNENIYFTGFIEFKSYEEKLKFLNTGVYWFGLNVHRTNFVRFNDADFMNVLKISNPLWLNRDSRLVLKDLNRMIGNSGLELQLPEYFDKTIPRDKIWDKQLWLRFNSFDESYLALKTFEGTSSDHVKII